MGEAPNVPIVENIKFAIINAVSVAPPTVCRKASDKGGRANSILIRGIEPICPIPISLATSDNRMVECAVQAVGNPVTARVLRGGSIPFTLSGGPGDLPGCFTGICSTLKSPFSRAFCIRGDVRRDFTGVRARGRSQGTYWVGWRVAVLNNCPWASCRSRLRQRRSDSFAKARRVGRFVPAPAWRGIRDQWLRGRHPGGRSTAAFRSDLQSWPGSCCGPVDTRWVYRTRRPRARRGCCR